MILIALALLLVVLVFVVLRNFALEGRCWRLRRQLERLGETPEWDEPHHQEQHREVR